MKPYARNPRQITKKRFDRLTDTLTRLGDLGGIVHNLETDEIIGGNQRMAVFRDGVPTVVEQYDQPDEQGTVAHGFIVWNGKKYAYRQVRWDEHTAAEANIRANVEAGTWDFDALSGWDAGDLQAWGFDAELLKDWNTGAGALALMLEADEDAPPEDPGPQVDKAEELREKWGVQPGQLWELDSGNGHPHRLICGDCTDLEVVARVMGGEKAQFCVTSPPYPDAKMWETSAPELIKVGHDCLLVLRDVVDTGAAICWNTSDVPCGQTGVAPNPARDTMAALEIGWTKRAEIVWEKGLSYLPAPWNTRRPTVPNVTHELILVFFNGERVPREKEGRLDVDALAWNRETVWKMSPAKASKENHKAPFPLELAERCIILFSFDGDLVYDPFLGSGTTLIAAERLGRRCRACEISPAYVGVALERFYQMTGVEPVLLEAA